MSYMDIEAGKCLLLEVDDILTHLSIPHFLFQGTALGAYRDAGFTPTEKDIDIGVLIEDLMPHVPFLLMELLKHQFDIECFTMPLNLPRMVVAFKSYKGHVAKCDIVGMIKWKGKRFIATPVRDYITPYCLVHDAGMVEPPYDTVEVFGRNFSVPHPIEDYLKHEYGNWKTPIESHDSLARVYNYLIKEGIDHHV